MKIGICDNNNRKFIKPLIERWEQDGHEVWYEMGFNPKPLEWSDLFYCDMADNNAKVATNKFRTELKNKKFFVRCLDIEYWVGHHHGIDWSVVDGLIFLNKNLQTQMVSEINAPKNKVIHCGIDLSKFPLKKTHPNKKIAMVVGRNRIYNDKRVDEAVRILYEVSRFDSEYTLHILGTDSHGQKMYCHYLAHVINSLNLNDKVFFTDYVDNVSEWLEDKTYLLSCGIKEAFGYAIGEAMAKGVKPVINNFWGAEDLWPKKFIYNSHAEAVGMLLSVTQPEEYRKFVEDNYGFERYYKEMNEFIGIA